MTIVCDASAAVNYSLDIPVSTVLARYIDTADLILVPDFFPYEVTNAFWKYHRFRDLDLASCESGIRQCLAIPDEFVPGLSLVQDAFTLAGRTQHPVYDCCYLECARRNNGTLLTTDKSLAAVGKKYNIDVTLVKY